MKITKIITSALALTALMGVTMVSAQAAPMSKMSMGMTMAHGRYGGSAYTGAPALNVTASLVKAGGGPGHFSTAKLVASLAGPKAARAEVAKLTRQYGKARVASYIQVSDFSVEDALRIATKAGVKLPKANLSGKALAVTLVKAGIDKDGTFNTELLLDKAVTHKIHGMVMDDIDKKYGGAADASYHKISNQAFYDLAHALGLKTVKLSKFH